ncbi:MAG: YkgJ family cysteine cluster protein [Bryobacteraceae bacterium]
MNTGRLHVIQQEVRFRVEQTTLAEETWPCRKGCDDCCRRLASVPIVTREEWRLIATHLQQLGPEMAASLRERIRDSAQQSRPVACPLLDTHAGTCLVYDARPVACRAYGFYAERENVLGCNRIELKAEQCQDVVWGNHTSLEQKLQSLGPAAELYRWLDEEPQFSRK